MPTFYTFERRVQTSNTFRLAGRKYPTPGFEVGQTLIVSPVSRTNDVRILGIPESIPDGDGIIVQPIEDAI